MNFKLQVLSPTRPIANVPCSGLLVPGVDGYFEILSGHTAIIAEIGVGELIVRKSEGEPLRYFIAGGYVEAANDSVTVLADTIEAQNEVDCDRAARAQKRAEERLVKSDTDVDVARALSSLKRAAGRLGFAESARTARSENH